jgi:hypothetical protein
MTAIDVWAIESFDPGLLRYLEGHASTITGYFELERSIFLDYDLGRGRDRFPMRPDNPYGAEYIRLWENFSEILESRTIRGWHYTRLTDREARELLRDGLQLSTPESLRRRLNMVVADGELADEVADHLYARSPFHSDQFESRNNRFWMASHPIAVDHGGVQPLLEHWGGEVASMWVKDETMLAALTVLGRPRIIEVAAPVALADCGLNAARAVMATSPDLAAPCPRSLAST